MFREDVDDQSISGSPSARPEIAHFGANDIGWQALGPAIACTILATGIVATRWYTRSVLVRCVGGDDVVILLSLILAWAMTAIIAVEVHEGVGNYNGPEHLSDLTKMVVTNNSLWALCVTITKLSILMQYLRVFSDRITRCLCYVLVSLLLPAVCWAIFGGTFLCRPVAKLWNPQLPGECLSAQSYWISAASIDIGLDFLVLLLPMPAIAALRLPRKDKVALVLVFLLGFVVCIVSVARLATVISTASQGDYVMSGVWAIIWSAAEANVGITCASLLALKPLVAKMCPHLMEETKLPRHSMRLPVVTAGAPSDEAMLVSRALGSLPISPTTNKSQDDSAVEPPRTALAPTTLDFPEKPAAPAMVHAATEGLERSKTARCQDDATLSFVDMLASDCRRDACCSV